MLVSLFESLMLAIALASLLLQLLKLIVYIVGMMIKQNDRSSGKD